MNAPAALEPNSIPLFYQTVNNIIVELAHEGVPVMAIARATKTGSDEVFEILKAAVADGRLIELPRADWPQGKKVQRSEAEASVLSATDDQLVVRCSSLFKLTRLQATVFLQLLRRQQLTKEQVHLAIEGNRSDAKEPTDPKMVDVVIYHIRKKLKAYEVAVETIWGVGYTIRMDDRERAMQLLKQAGAQ